MATGVLIQQLIKGYSVSGRQHTVLEKVSVSIERGEFVTLIGQSGCGKSTLLRLIAGLEQDYSGEILLSGKKVSGAGLDRGVVFQNPRLFPWFSVEENIALGLQGGLQAHREKVDKYVKLVGLQGFEQALPRQLSGGMAQRVAIARALIHNPEVLLLDEPFSALDALTREKLHEELLKIWEEEKVTVILVTHDIDEAVILSDRVFVLSKEQKGVKEAVTINLERPRDRNSLHFVEIRKKLTDLIKQEL